MDDESGESVEPTEDVLYWLAALDSLLPALHFQVTTLGKLFTHMCLYNQAV